MPRHLAICGVEQHREASNLHITDEIINREIVSNYHSILELEAEKLRNMNSMSVRVHNQNYLPDVSKVFYFVDVTVNETEHSVEVQFSDGHKECFDEAEVVKSYNTLRLSDYGPAVAGVTRNKDTDTVHFVDTDGQAVCGDSNVPKDETPMDFDIDSDSLSFYRPVCGRCKNVYSDDFIQTLIDLRLSPKY